MALMASLSGGVAFAVETPNIGTVNISVLDENGNVVPEAPVYIYGENKTKFMGGNDIPGTTTFSMPAGTYRISSAIVMKTGDYVDRFASHEAHVQVIAGDNAVVVLKLMPLDQMETMSYAELNKIGIHQPLN